jgi:hypothetical protein
MGRYSYAPVGMTLRWLFGRGIDGPEGARRGMRVLLAEPTRIGRSIMERLLAEEGYTLIPMATAEDALAALHPDNSDRVRNDFRP